MIFLTGKPRPLGRGASLEYSTNVFSLMKSNLTSGQTRWLGMTAQFAAIGTAICFFSFVTADPDLWGHIKFGAALWEGGALVRTDPYSFTANGYPWINHEWLAELIFYFIYYYFKDAGLLIGKLFVGVVIVCLIGQLCAFRKKDPIIYAMIMITAVMIMSPGFMIRPQLFSFLFFTCYLYLLHLFFTSQKNRLFLLPCLMIFWVNLHGGFLMGLALLFAVVMWKSLAYLALNNQDKRIGWLWFWFFMTIGATLFNPYGYHLLIFLYKTLSLPRPIGEWHPMPLWNLSYLHFKLTALIFFLIVFFQTRRQDGWEASAIGMTMVASFLHQRHSPFFGIIVVPYLINHLSIVIENIQTRFPQLVLTSISKKIIAMVLGLLACYQVFCGASKYILSHARIIVDPKKYPVAAVEYLKKNNISGRLLLPMEWGEYAIWKLHPACSVSIDGRFRTVYPESVIQDHFVADRDDAGWQHLIEKYPADILLARQIDFFQKLTKNSESWVYIYSDSTAIIFLHKEEKNKQLIKRYKEGLFSRPDPPSMYFP